MTRREFQQHIDHLVAEESARVERECRRLLDQGIKPAIIVRPMFAAEVIDARLAPDWAPHDDDPETSQEPPARAGPPPTQVPGPAPPDAP